jgi:hypothetical protein
MKVRGMPRTSTAHRPWTIAHDFRIDRHVSAHAYQRTSLRPLRTLRELKKSLGKPTEIPRSGCEHPAWNDAGREASLRPLRTLRETKKITQTTGIDRRTTTNSLPLRPLRALCETNNNLLIPYGKSK